MPRTGHPAKWTFLSVALMLALGFFPTARAQYVGKVDTSKSKGPTLRATAILEYTGDLDKPTASRLIPIAVWDGERYQPGGLYMANPVPLTVETGTQYVLEKAGTPKGLFDVKAAANVRGSWIAIGNYQKPPTPKEAKLKPSRHPPVIVDDSKPHFAHVPAGDTKEGATNAKAENNAPPVDPNRPRLQQRSADAGASSGSATESKPAAPPIDPDRPILREPAKPTAEAKNETGGNQAPETVAKVVDPNRPHLGYGKPAEQQALDQPSKVIASLAGPQPDIEQIAAVSDAANRPPQSYAYSWNSPEDEQEMRGKVESIAQQMLAASEPKTFGAAPKKQPRHGKARKVEEPRPPTLSDEQFKAYALSYGGGATLVFSATEGEGEAARYITLIAQPDFNGTPIILFKHITSQRDLSVVPRMKLVDAVDTDADNQAELIFALENNAGRHYAIYRVTSGSAEQVFASGS